MHFVVFFSNVLLSIDEDRPWQVFQFVNRRFSFLFLSFCGINSDGSNVFSSSENRYRRTLYGKSYEVQQWSKICSTTYSEGLARLVVIFSRLICSVWDCTILIFSCRQRLRSVNSNSLSNCKFLHRTNLLLKYLLYFPCCFTKWSLPSLQLLQLGAESFGKGSRLALAESSGTIYGLTTVFGAGVWLDKVRLNGISLVERIASWLDVQAHLWTVRSHLRGI